MEEASAHADHGRTLGVDKLTPEQWAAIVRDVLALQPELAAITVQAMQEGILEAQDRLRERIADVSMGLVEALNTKRGQVKRRSSLIIKAIMASTVYGSKWATETIAKEEQDG